MIKLMQWYGVAMFYVFPVLVVAGLFGLPWRWVLLPMWVGLWIVLVTAIDFFWTVKREAKQ